MWFSRETIPGVVVVAGLVSLVSCASVPASRVRVARESDNEAARIGPLESCGYIGKVETAASGDADGALRQLREQAGRRGANTLVLRSGPGPLRGTAFLCPAFASHSIQTADRGSIPYGPDPPSAQGYPKGAFNVPADPRR